MDAPTQTTSPVQAPPKPSAPRAPTRRADLRAWAVLTSAGWLGVASIAPYAADVIRSLPEAESPLPVPALIAISLLQAAVFTLLAAGLGVLAAPRVGFVSRVQRAFRGEVQRPWRPEAAAAVVGGVLAAAALIGGELVFLSVLGDDLRAVWAEAPRTLEVTLQGFLYGGITEELLMRFALVSGVAWLLWRAILRRGGSVAPWAAAVAVAVVALLFGLGHLPATSLLVELDAVWVTRALVLNGVAALVFGWLYVRHSLEAAMVAHAGAHLVVTVVAWATPLF